MTSNEKPEPQKGSPLDTEGIDLDITTEVIVAFIEEGRQTYEA